MRHVVLILLFICSIHSFGQKSGRVTHSFPVSNDFQDQEIEPFIYSDTSYVVGANQKIRIQNSFPKGGFIAPGEPAGYTDPLGMHRAFGLVWTRIINNTNDTITFKLKTSTDVVEIGTPAKVFMNLYVPKEEMTLERMSKFNYGFSNAKSFLNEHYNSAMDLEITLKLGEEHLFYVLMLFYAPGNGAVRPALVKEEDELLYQINVEPYGIATLPMGKLYFSADH